MLNYIHSDFFYTEEEFISEDECEKLKKYIYDNKHKTDSLTISNIGGWHSPLYDGKKALPEFEQLFELIENKVKEIGDTFGLKVNLGIDNWWINVNGKHAFNQRHTHTRSLFSGVFYVQIPDNESGRIRFFPTSNDKHHFLEYFHINDESDLEKTVLSVGIVGMQPIDRQLVIFPSWLPHDTTPNLSDDDRIAISFNVKRV